MQVLVGQAALEIAQRLRGGVAQLEDGQAALTGTQTARAAQQPPEELQLPLPLPLRAVPFRGGLLRGSPLGAAAVAVRLAVAQQAVQPQTGLQRPRALRPLRARVLRQRSRISALQRLQRGRGESAHAVLLVLRRARPRRQQQKQQRQRRAAHPRRRRALPAQRRAALRAGGERGGGGRGGALRERRVLVRLCALRAGRSWHRVMLTAPGVRAELGRRGALRGHCAARSALRCSFPPPRPAVLSAGFAAGRGQPEADPCAVPEPRAQSAERRAAAELAELGAAALAAAQPMSVQAEWAEGSPRSPEWFWGGGGHV